MKYILILLSLSLYSQVLTVPRELNQHLSTWKLEADSRGIPAFSKLIRNIDTIEFIQIPFPQLGRTDTWGRKIELNEFIKLDTLMLRAVLYHELFHGVVWNGRHNCSLCSDIMGEYGPSTYAIWLDDESWKKALDKYFQQMQKYLKKK